ncbi:hypothetical protein ACIQOU_04330 [Streptomyces sp. NPDC091279]|uniref:hypothetical protein n=1 Tax=unclassified Streptomyces TaxID=2593676 RepID=UPI003813A572
MHGIYILANFARTFTGRDQRVASTREHLEADQNRVLLGISSSSAVGLMPQTFEIFTVLRIGNALNPTDSDPDDPPAAAVVR